MGLQPPATRRMANGSAARPGPEGRPVVIHFKLKDAGVTSHKPATQEIRHPYQQLRFDLSQCVMDGPGVPSDQAPATTMKIVARSSGSFAAITGEPGRFAPQLLAAFPET